MPWPLRLVVLHDGYPIDYETHTPGSLWEIDEDDYPLSWYSADYMTIHRGKRGPLMVRLPDGTAWCLDMRANGPDGFNGVGWVVTGDAPEITVTPSLNLVGRYHGFITSGTLSEDIEGRTYKPIP